MFFFHRQSILQQRRYFWIKGESCLPEGTIGAGKPSSFAIISCDSGSSMSPSSIVKPNKQFNPILFYSIQYKWNNDAKELNSEWCRRYPNGPTRTIVRIGAQVHHFLCTKSQSVRMVHGLNPCAMRTVCTSKSVRRQLCLKALQKIKGLCNFSEFYITFMDGYRKKRCNKYFFTWLN